MNRLLKSSNIEDAYNLSDLNWEDETLETGIGDIDGSDPSMKGYNKGWQMEPYKERFYAKTKLSAKEVTDNKYDAKSLADKILETWSQYDGPLQNFFEGFTMNKMDNKLKKQIANELRERGYDVYPVLEDQKPKYASKIITSLKEELREIKSADYNLSKSDIGGLLSYYIKIYPKDYAIRLVTSPKFVEFVDYQYSNDTLDALENILNGQADSINTGYTNGLNRDFGMDSLTDMRSDEGFPINQYEAKKKR